LAARYRIDVADNLAARRIRTQAQVLRRVAVVVIGMVALSAMLMTFPAIWNIGAGLFASAGAAGLVVGMAALHDHYVIQPDGFGEGDLGMGRGDRNHLCGGAHLGPAPARGAARVFHRKPFQNWTRTSADNLGTVFVYVDYSVPVEEVRHELHSILTSCGL
jgi:hypothetical protein